MSNPQPGQEPDVRRTAPRANARLAVVAVTPRGRVSGLVLDISEGGAKLFMDEAFDCGSEVLLHWLDHEVYAVVTWSRGHECGVHFTRPLEQVEFLLLSAALGKPRPVVDEAVHPVSVETRQRASAALTGRMVGQGFGRRQG